MVEGFSHPGSNEIRKERQAKPPVYCPYEILEKIGNLAYRLALPMELERVHNVFHVFQLKKYVHDPSHVISSEVVPLDGTMSYEERLLRILDFKTRETRRKSVKMVKVWWSHHGVDEATWELESVMRVLSGSVYLRYPAFPFLVCSLKPGVG
ncbi:PREDICTED: uncharacterized protein LOC109174931 [Ipomoea nil]|uniref:uncharacterized protein LOC109174931 n=1 Tax=Ipomoea nil TaxID=35883 RepID=UPI000900CE5B|nr:PREDICTED: uncharacterized protein LOC109174931 [Ipomoea nil]